MLYRHGEFAIEQVKMFFISLYVKIAQHTAHLVPFVLGQLAGRGILVALISSYAQPIPGVLFDITSTLILGEPVFDYVTF